MGANNGKEDFVFSVLVKLDVLQRRQKTQGKQKSD